jgi:hypothetical protein
MNFSARQRTIGNEDTTLLGEVELDTRSSFLRELLPALERLDLLLGRAVALAREAYGLEASEDRFRGLHISDEEVDRLLTQGAGVPTLCMSVRESEAPASDSVRNPPRLAWLQRTYGLSSFDLDVLLMALAPELDLRYERLYAYLQDDVSKRHPMSTLL